MVGPWVGALTCIYTWMVLRVNYIMLLSLLPRAIICCPLMLSYSPLEHPPSSTVNDSYSASRVTDVMRRLSFPMYRLCQPGLCIVFISHMCSSHVMRLSCLYHRDYSHPAIPSRRITQVLPAEILEQLGRPSSLLLTEGKPYWCI